MNTKTKEGARNEGNPYFLRAPWNKGGLVNTGPGPNCHDSYRTIKTLNLNIPLVQLSGHLGH